MSDERTLSLMREFMAPPTATGLDLVRGFSSEQLVASLNDLDLSRDVVRDVVDNWDGFRREAPWVQLLASMVELVDRQRGDADTPIPIWSDLEGSGPNGRLLYVYAFALCARATREFLRRAGVADAVVDATLGVFADHVTIHQRKYETTGVDAGWWMLLLLRGELVQVGSLQYHRVTLGVGTLSPFPWYDEEEIAARGIGFRVGDPSLGIHIPDRADLSPHSVDASLDEARRVLGDVWPAPGRRLATCQTWMLDDRLRGMLSSSSNIVHFQHRFTLLPRWYEDDGDVIEFVFRRPDTALENLPQSTSLERAIVRVLRSGSHWRNRTGWLDFDGV